MAEFGEASSPSAGAKKPTFWDPLGDHRNRLPTRECLRRIRKDLRTLQKDPLPGIFVVPDEVCATIVHALVTGPFETPCVSRAFSSILFPLLLRLRGGVPTVSTRPSPLLLGAREITAPRPARMFRAPRPRSPPCRTLALSG